jgi:YidC/Oxa1 family membrane protein insertase
MEEKKELSMETRLLLAFLLMGLVLFGTQYFYKPPPQPPQATVAKNVPPVAPAEAARPAAPAPPAAPPAEMPGQIKGDKEETVSIDTELYTVVLSNHGGVVRSWILKRGPTGPNGQMIDYKDHNGKPLELVNTAAIGKVPDPFSLATSSDPNPKFNDAFFKIDRASNGLSAMFEYSDGRQDIKKLFKFSQSSYLVEVNTQVLENGVPVAHSIVWRGGFGDETVIKAYNDQRAVYYDLTATKLTENEAKTAKNGPVSVSGRDSFAGLEDKYFAGVFLPRGHNAVQVTTYSDTVPDGSGSDEQHVGTAVGGDGINDFQFFVGPKDTDLLKRVDPKLETMIDWGWFEVLAKPLFLVLNWTADHAVHNWGWAIILVTVVINLLLFPLRISSMKSAKKMQRLQPQIKAINDKYKNVGLRDPKKAEQNQEIMDLYKREGVNPMGGCAPMLIQLPFLYAFYKVLAVSVEMRGAGWLWVHDLSQPETIPIRILPILLIVTQFATQKMTPQAPGADPSQQKMMMFMPLVFGYIFYFLSSGLVLYYLTGNVVGIALQWLMNRGGPPPAPVVVDVKPTPKKKR